MGQGRAARICTPCGFGSSYISTVEEKPHQSVKHQWIPNPHCWDHQAAGALLG